MQATDQPKAPLIEGIQFSEKGGCGAPGFAGIKQNQSYVHIVEAQPSCKFDGEAPYVSVERCGV
jgi:hypothetical protein